MAGISVKVASSEKSELVGFVSVPVATLRLDAATEFDLYLPPRGGKPPVLYRNGHLAFTEEAKARLDAGKIGRLLVPAKQGSVYRRYIERNLGSILSDPSVPMEERTTLLYGSAKGLVKEILDDPRSGGLLERAGNMVEHMVQFMFAESRSFQHLMRVTSFDYYTYTHSVNVFVFSTGLAQRLGCSQEEALDFGQGGLLHDVGKSQIDPTIVNCRGKLSDEQWQEMKKHPVYGQDIMQQQGEENPVILDVIRHHHEKLSGNGYPDGLAGDELSLWVRISTIADVFDALTTRRSYKEAMDSFPSLRLMKEEMSKDLDPDVFRAFVELMGGNTA